MVLGTDIYTPLGARRPVKPARSSGKAGALVFLLAGCLIVGFSFWVALAPSNLLRQSDLAAMDERQHHQESLILPLPAPDPSTTLPLLRDSKPGNDLFEDSPYGRLPMIGSDGVRPLDRYARPWSGKEGPRIAIIIGGLGLSQTLTQRAIAQLPENITLAFAATGNSLERWGQEARRGGHEILLQLPLQSVDHPADDPGSLTLLTRFHADKNVDLLHQSLARLTHYTGVMNYLGDRFMADSKSMEPVMRDLAARGLLFVDDGTARQSLSTSLANKFSMPHIVADVKLDQKGDRAAILARLSQLEQLARAEGTATGFASGFDLSIEVIAEWSLEAAKRGIEIVGVSVLAAP